MMKTLIHPTAVVHPNAEIHPSAQIGPYAVIGEEVVIGATDLLFGLLIVEIFVLDDRHQH